MEAAAARGSRRGRWRHLWAPLVAENCRLPGNLPTLDECSTPAVVGLGVSECGVPGAYMNGGRLQTFDTKENLQTP